MAKYNVPFSEKIATITANIQAAAAENFNASVEGYQGKVDQELKNKINTCLSFTAGYSHYPQQESANDWMSIEAIPTGHTTMGVDMTVGARFNVGASIGMTIATNVSFSASGKVSQTLSKIQSLTPTSGKGPSLTVTGKPLLTTAIEAKVTSSEFVDFAFGAYTTENEIGKAVSAEFKL